jgi:hypothetical protein
LKHLFGYTQRFWNKPDSANTAAFSIASIVHLRGRLENILSRHRNGTDKTRYTAATFFFSVKA